MSGVQRFLSGHKNHIRGATFDGPVMPITDAVIQRAIARQGSSSGVVTGTFTGKEQAEYEVEMLDTATDVPPVTKPIFSGVGNGTISDIVVTGLTARTFTVELTDLGTQLQQAGADISGIRLKAKTPGSAGNTFSLKIDRTPLVITPASFSLLAVLPSGSKTVTGPQFDWNTVTIGADNVVPAGAKRIVFGGDKGSIYVQYKRFLDGEFTYFFEPEIKDDIPQSAQIGFVTGDYTVELFDGDVVVETYAGVRSLYDLLNAIKLTSTRLVVEGALGRDQGPGGNAVADLQVRTDAYVSQNSGTGSNAATGFINIGVDIDAGTQLVTAECIAATPADAVGAGVGSEQWRVTSSLAGALGKFKSGDVVRGSDFAATIPRRLPPIRTSAPTGSFDLVDIVYDDSTRPTAEGGGLLFPHPGICVNGRALGINAFGQQLTLTYVKRPPVDNCSCKEGPYNLDPACLGLTPPSTEGGFSVSYKAETVTRLVALYDWLATTVRENSSYNVRPNSVVDPGDTGGLAITSADGIQDPFISNPTPGSASFASSITSEGIKFNLLATPTLTNYQKKSLFDLVTDFENTIAELDKLVDGAYKTAGLDAWDAAVLEFQTDVDTYMTGGAGTETSIIEAGEALTAKDIVVIVQIGAAKKAYKSFNHPAAVGWGFVLDDVVLGDPATVHNYGDLLAVGNVVDSANVGCGLDALFVTAAGTGYGVAPCRAGYIGNDLQAGSYILAAPRFIALKASAAPYDFYLPQTNSGVLGMNLLTDRYGARTKFILISAGISPLGKADAGSDTAGGDGCWQDAGDPFYWKVEGSAGGTYANAFSNQPYYSSKKAPGGANGGQSDSYISTKEFGFYLDIPCPNHLAVGDKIILQIGNAQSAGPRSYARGDMLTLGIVAAQNIAFGGGQDGDNVQTWYVGDSVLGPRPSYLLDTDTPTAYTGSGLEFLINQGSIAYHKGDTFVFSIEGGHFQWRKTVNGVPTAWSASIALTTAPFALDSGLSLQFTLGASPAFFTGDTYKFLALQPHALSNVVKPDFDAWQWGAPNPATMSIDLGGNKLIEAIGLAFHSIPEGATVEVHGGEFDTTDWVEVLVWQKDVMAKLLAAPREAQFIDLIITGGAGGGIGYLFIGETTKFTHSAQVSLNREYKIKRSSGDVNPYASFQGKAIGGSIQWTEGHLAEDDYVPMVEMLDWLKVNNDEPLIFFPQETRDSEVVMASCESDSIAFNDVYNFQPDAGRERRLSCTIPLRGVAFT